MVENFVMLRGFLLDNEKFSKGEKTFSLVNLIDSLEIVKLLIGELLPKAAMEGLN